jgi:hypothetical protein
MTNRIQWPEGKEFAFTIFDDTDYQTVDHVSAVYSFLSDIGLRTTKSVWPIRGSKVQEVWGATCEDKQYLEWVLDLQQKGFEIALHNVTSHTSTRAETAHGLETFRRLFGHYPYSMANHSGCNEGIYWGDSRLTGINQVVYNLLHLKKYKGVFQGHVENSPLFWGDLCREKVKYVRNFVFGDINTLKLCPFMPYHDPARPYVNNWFAASEGPLINSFNAMLSEDNQEKLATERGACIMYAHLACGFLENGKINRRFRSLMERLGRMNGWFVPVHTLLDYFLEVRGTHNLIDHERKSLERKWLMHKIVNTRGTT